jgi:enamine deaminase RidA (YjgF/YER057c/UK114 family)
MDRRAINPWNWQAQFGFVQANEVREAQRILIISGQTAIDGNGHVVAARDMAGQVRVALDNLETVLQEADMSLQNLVRLTFYTVDMDRFLAEASEVLASRLAEVEYAASYLGITRLAFPDLLVEIEATAIA